MLQIPDKLSNKAPESLSSAIFDDEFISGGSSIYSCLKKFLFRFPHLFEKDLFNEFHCFFALSLPAFRRLRFEKHLIRMILTQYKTRKDVKHALLLAPEKRHLSLRLLPTTLNTAFGKKPVLGVMLTISLSGQFEYFDEEHLLLAIQKSLPSVYLIRGSRYVYRHPEEEKILTLYAEVDKEHGSFSLREKAVVLRTFSQELKDRVQKLLPSIYNVRNEENIMKNMITLSQELKETNSLPQMIISFEGQIEKALIFTVVLAYVGNRKIEEDLFLELNDPSIEITFARKQRMGYFECQTSKESLVLRAKVFKLPELHRRDFSVDAYTARKKVQGTICRVIGDVRDYDGGLIQKQRELFSIFQNRFTQHIQDHGDLLEHFFYSITPIEKQATIPIAVLEVLFSYMLASLNEDFSKRGAHFLREYEDENYFYAFVRSEGNALVKHVQTMLCKHPDLERKLTLSTFSYQETLCTAYLLESDDSSLRTKLKDLLSFALKGWQKERQNFQQLRLNLIDLPFSLDPRMAGDEVTKVIIQMLFDGLMRSSEDGKPECAIAKSVEVSEDLRTYIFKLKETFWSNHHPLQAADFAYAWKKILSPSFDTPFAHVFYCIKNALPVKQGTLPLDAAGIYELDAYTLKVELEYPVSYFLELLTQPLFAPVYRFIDNNNPQWALADGDAFVCNGPFYLKKNQGDRGFILERNPQYWDEKGISLNRIVFNKTSARAAFEMFKQGKLDWLGRPMRVWEPFFALAKTENAEYVSLKERVTLCMLNTSCFPLTSTKLRQALALCVDRQEFIENLNLNSPAFSPLHSYHTFYPESGSSQGEVEYAQLLFQEALQELSLSSSSFPTIVLEHLDSEYWKQIASILKSQWKRFLGIEMVSRSCSWPQLLRKLSKGDYMLSMVTWFSWVNDPMYTLNAFKFSVGGTNFAQWENSEFQNLLSLASQEKNIRVRSSYLARAEATLIKESPLIPIAYEKEMALKTPSLTVPLFRGTANFKQATIRKKP